MNLKRKIHKVEERLYSFFDALRIRQKKGRTLFIDGGANLGQGFTWFSKFYTGGKITFHLFEPNPYCFPKLNKIIEHSNRDIELKPYALGTENKVGKFYGLSEDQGGKLSQGGSLNSQHNTKFYEVSDQEAIEVEVIDFGTYLEKNKQKYDHIVLKLDVEGAEIEILNYLLRTNFIQFIDTLYVEFHSMYQVEPQKSKTESEEIKLWAQLKKCPTKVRLWH
ncbi:MAG: FkbM family methyltransferase [Alphaproteobacteria bacterium]